MVAEALRMPEKIVFAAEASGVKVYWDGKGWTADRARAKRFEPRMPLIVTYDFLAPLAGIDVFFAEQTTVPSPKDWSPRKRRA